MQVLTPGTSQRFLIWRQELCRCDYIKDLEMARLSWIIWMAINAITSVFTRERQREI